MYRDDSVVSVSFSKLQISILVYIIAALDSKAHPTARAVSGCQAHFTLHIHQVQDQLVIGQHGYIL